jgi:pimeloyl-ACP methyl ester carboxylesterase
VRKVHFAPGNDARVWTGGWHRKVSEAQNVARVSSDDTWLAGGNAPMLILQGEFDVVAPPANAEALQRAYPDRVTVLMVPNAGHAMLPEQPERISAAIIEYLRKRTP